LISVPELIVAVKVSHNEDVNVVPRIRTEPVDRQSMLRCSLNPPNG
jgi:hypothetical protein